jgi:hypothetical protein
VPLIARFGRPSTRPWTCLRGNPPSSPPHYQRQPASTHRSHHPLRSPSTGSVSGVVRSAFHSGSRHTIATVGPTATASLDRRAFPAASSDSDQSCRVDSGTLGVRSPIVRFRDPLSVAAPVSGMPATGISAIRADSGRRFIPEEERPPDTGTMTTPEYRLLLGAAHAQTSSNDVERHLRAALQLSGGPIPAEFARTCDPPRGRPAERSSATDPYALSLTTGAIRPTDELVALARAGGRETSD